MSRLLSKFARHASWVDQVKQPLAFVQGRDWWRGRRGGSQGPPV